MFAVRLFACWAYGTESELGIPINLIEGLVNLAPVSEKLIPDVCSGNGKGPVEEDFVPEFQKVCFDHLYSGSMNGKIQGQGLGGRSVLQGLSRPQLEGLGGNGGQGQCFGEKVSGKLKGIRRRIISPKDCVRHWSALVSAGAFVVSVLRLHMSAI